MKEDNRIFKTEADVQRFFLTISGIIRASISRNHINDFDNKTKLNGIMIDTKLRKEILTGPTAGKITIGGRLEQLEFKDLRGGVWNCTVTDYNRVSN